MLPVLLYTQFIIETLVTIHYGSTPIMNKVVVAYVYTREQILVIMMMMMMMKY